MPRHLTAPDVAALFGLALVLAVIIGIGAAIVRDSRAGRRFR